MERSNIPPDSLKKEEKLKLNNTEPLKKKNGDPMPPTHRSDGKFKKGVTWDSQFKPGHKLSVGYGRRGSVRDQLRKMLESKKDIGPNGKTDLEQILEKVIEMSKRGNLQAINLLMDRYLGKPTAHVEVTAKDTIEIE